MATRGRPSKISQEKLHVAIGMAKMGATDEQIADALDVSRSTISLWKEQNKGFSDTIKNAKDEADEKVERSLYQLATGYEYDAEKPLVVSVGNGKSAVEIAKYREKVPPNTTAMIFWLKNRQPAKWRDKQEVEHSGEIGVTIIDDIK